MNTPIISTHDWPELNFQAMQKSIETLHQWIQIVGKVRLNTMPWQNHSWHAALYVTTEGFSTHSIPYKGRSFQIDFDFRTHQLHLRCSDKGVVSMGLYSRTVADFYSEFMEKLASIGISVSIFARPNEVDPSIPFAKNEVNATYDPLAANKIWLSMLKTANVFHYFRSSFTGKVSPVHLFWGAFDLAVTRFSGKTAPLHPGGMPNMPLKVMQEAYAQEVSSVGFWLGSADAPEPVYYAYIYPGNANFGLQKVAPESAFFNSDMGEYFLKYSDVRKAENPERYLLSFLQTTFEAAVKTANWDGATLGL